MNTQINRLLQVASEPLSNQWSSGNEQFAIKHGQAGVELIELLRMKNGFYAFESALHVFYCDSNGDHMSLQTWNAPETWRTEYGNLIHQDMLFFAEDAYGNQFAISKGEVVLFYSEFAEIEFISKSISEWAEILLSDWRGFTGYELAHDWQCQHRPLREGERLTPKVPFVIGGKYETSNLYAGRSVDVMRFRGSLAQQLANIPDGAPVNLEITPSTNVGAKK